MNLSLIDRSIFKLISIEYEVVISWLSTKLSEEQRIRVQLGACRDKRRLKGTSIILPSHALGLDRFERKSVSTLSIFYLRVRVKLFEAIYLSAGRFSYNMGDSAGEGE